MSEDCHGPDNERVWPNQIKARKKSRLELWKAYHAGHPEVFEIFMLYARQAAKSGRRRIGARLIGERIRWYANIERKHSDEWLINDHYWPYYSRLAMLVDDTLVGLFARRDSNFDASDEEIVEAHLATQAQLSAFQPGADGESLGSSSS